ncbi:hypothetical protein ACFL4W_02255 [Planctomycetota bacterium]
MKKTLLAAVLMFACLIVPVCGEEIYFKIMATDLTLTDEAFPTEEAADRGGRLNWRQRDFLQPRATGKNGVEVYVKCHGSGGRWNAWQTFPQAIGQVQLFVRCTEFPAEGTFFAPNHKGPGMDRYEFTIPELPKERKGRLDTHRFRRGPGFPVIRGGNAGDTVLTGPTTKKEFYTQKAEAYEKWLREDIPGSAWFRHQAGRARAVAADKPDADFLTMGTTAQAPRRRGDPELMETYALFSGGRAVSENLRLDRELIVRKLEDETVDITAIEGITTAEIDWQAIIAGKDPERDPLAALIPADQHVVFFPSFKQMIELMDESEANGVPVLQFMEMKSEDAFTRKRYEDMLCMHTDALSRLLGPRLIQSIAFTGSDPYLRTGSDVAVIFESADPGSLSAALAARRAMAAAGSPGCKTVSGMVADTAYMGAVAPDRTICSYAAISGKTVIVSNSLVQLQKILDTAAGKVPNLGGLDEYVFFRDRYQRSEDENAFIILSDAAIRRWCGPQWRVGASRRTRAAAVLADLQARNAELIMAGRDAEILLPDRPVGGMGEFTFRNGFIHSSVYGSLRYLTPIAELDIQKVTEAEKAAYVRFREMYQRAWRAFFDPIGIRLTVKPDRIAADVTVRPLIASSEYRQIMDVAGAGAFKDADGDPHKEALLHLIMALDVKSRTLQRFNDMGQEMAMLQFKPLAWLGKWITLYADEGPFWKELGEAGAKEGEQGMENFMERNFMRLPVAIEVDVADGFKLTGFIVALRAFIEQSTPGMTTWTPMSHNDHPYVKVAPSPAAIEEGAGDLEEFKDIAVYYSASAKGLVVTMNEDLLKRAIDRKLKPKKNKLDGWKGKSMAVRAQPGALKILEALYSEAFITESQIRSWKNIYVLNEWRKVFPGKSPEDIHFGLWNIRLKCPGGGKYVWDEELMTMESTVFGSPSRPKKPKSLESVLFDVKGAQLGVTFEGDGIRAKAELKK